MKILVCGGRAYDGDIDNALDAFHKLNNVSLVIHGDARGADTRSGYWAASRHIHVARVPALWGVYGNGAGGKRNQAMLELRPDYCIAFPGGSGTKDMIRRCKAAGVPVWEPYL